VFRWEGGPVLAIDWIPSQRIVDPANYVVPDPADPIRQGPVNVRLFKVREHPRGSVALDTLGLAAFGPRDLQVMLGDRATVADIGGWLFEAARHVFARGDFMKDRDTVDGVGGVLRCHHEVASIPPARRVLDFRPDVVAPVVGNSMGEIRCPSAAGCPMCSHAGSATAASRGTPSRRARCARGMLQGAPRHGLPSLR
jgi:hypothetical protein